MNSIVEGFQQALQLIAAGNSELFATVLRSLTVSGTATLLAILVGIPLAYTITLRHFPGRSLVIRLIYTAMSLPPVLLGLILFILLARRGPLGSLHLLFTVEAMIISQFILVTPIITGILISNHGDEIRRKRDLLVSLGAAPYQFLPELTRELRIPIFGALVAGFGRAISEVGAVMIVGGNIRHDTRMMTTSIVMLQSMGDYGPAIATGLILLFISLVINSILFQLQGSTREIG